MENLYERDVSFGIPSQEIPRYFTPVEVHELLRACESKPSYHLLFNLLWQTGARISEVLGLEVGDVDFYSKVIRLENLKRRKRSYRFLPLKDRIVDEIREYVVLKGIDSDRNARLFPLTRQAVFLHLKKICVEVGLNPQEVYPHTFRHSFAIHCILNKAPVIVVKEWLGHSSLLSTLVYVKILSRDTKYFFDDIDF